MSYIQSNLMNDESIVYEAKLHWIIFLWPLIWVVIGLMVMANNGPAILFFILAVITGIISFINFSTSEFGITTKRILVKTGLIRRNSIEVLLTKVEGIQVHQGILGRLLNYGTIIISGTGGSREPFHRISDPITFRKYAQEQIASVQDNK